MIGSIRHKGLRAYWNKGQTKGLNADWVARCRRIMMALNAASVPAEMNLPGYRFHALTGRMAGRYSVQLTGNFRVTFAWEDDCAVEVDIEDYH